MKKKFFPSVVIFISALSFAAIMFISVRFNDKNFKSFLTLKAALTTHTFTPTGRFYISNNIIVDPNGNRFTSKGVVTHYSTFLPSESDYQSGYADINFKNTTRDFNILQCMGVNTIRLFVADNANTAFDKQRLDTVIKSARSRGFVVEIANSYSLPNPSIPWLQYLATTYKNDPYIWLQPMDEPLCAQSQARTMGYPDKYCEDWAFWQQEHITYVKAIRASGFMNPIVINTISYSWDMRGIDMYSLNDNNIIYGVHRYGDDNVNFNDNKSDTGLPENQECDLYWKAASSSHAMIIDEVRNENDSGFKNSIECNKGFMDYVSSWINAGQGAIGFTWT